MASLSFDKGPDGSAVAIVKGGDYDREILYLHTGSAGGTKALPKKEINPTRYNSYLKHLKQAERVRLMNKIRECLEANQQELIGEPQAHKELYNKIYKDYHNDKGIELPDDSTFQPIPSPDPKTRNVWYVAGISGSGKSHFAKGIAESYMKLFPDREVYLISKLQQDDTLDSLKVNGKSRPPRRISLESLKDDYPALDEFQNCLVIFDDYDTLQKPYLEIVQQLIDDLAIQGRHTNTSMLVLSHYLTNYKKTRLILQEAHCLVMYPMATSFKAMKYVCENYGGIDADEIQKFKKMGRWVMLHKVFPIYVISAHQAYTLNG